MNAGTITPDHVRRLKAADYASRTIMAPRQVRVELFATALEEGYVEGLADAISVAKRLEAPAVVDALRELAKRRREGGVG